MQRRTVALQGRKDFAYAGDVPTSAYYYQQRCSELAESLFERLRTPPHQAIVSRPFRAPGSGSPETEGCALGFVLAALRA